MRGRGGERPQQPPHGLGAGGPGLPRRPSRGSRPAQLHELARRVRSSPDELARATLVAAVNGVSVYGHWGRPLLAFPAERGDAGEFERRGMVAAVGGLIEAGRVKLYCVDSFDAESWSNRDIPLEERARRHDVYESWILDQV